MRRFGVGLQLLAKHYHSIIAAGNQSGDADCHPGGSVVYSSKVQKGIRSYNREDDNVRQHIKIFWSPCTAEAFTQSSFEVSTTSGRCGNNVRRQSNRDKS